MNGSTLRNDLDTMMGAFGGHPEHPDVDWERYDRMTKLQEQRLYEELSKPHNTPGNPTCNVNDLMDEILS